MKTQAFCREKETYSMHRLLVTLTLLILPILAGCAGVANPLTGTTAGGGLVARESKLLGTPLPLGMDFYPEHSRIEGQDGMEVLRGDASLYMCASKTCTALQNAGWTTRLAYATSSRACYVFEKDGRLAVITIHPQSPTTLTLMVIYTCSAPPAGLPMPIQEKSSFSFGFGSGSEKSTDGSSGYPAEEGTGGLSTAPVHESGTIQERDL